MAKYEVGLEGTMSPRPIRGGADVEPGGKDNTKEAPYWVSHRGGPFLIHDNAGDCKPVSNDNAGYVDDLDVVIEQGFMSCPKCIK